MTRRRSLKKDVNDMRQFRHHRDRHLGFAVSNEYYQQTPFFFTRECGSINLVGQYKGASAFLVLNGPSLVNGNYDLSLLNAPGVVTYGVNNGPATFRPTFWSCVDDPSRFLKSIWLDPRIQKFVPHAHAEKPIFDSETWKELKREGNKTLVGECPNCVFFHRNEKFEPSRWLFEDKINWGNTKEYGGGRSVMLVAMRVLFLLGFRNVYLLGADFTMTEDYAYHFDEKRDKGAVNCNRGTYKKMKNEYFPKLKPYFKEEGFNVYNCNPDSGLDCFDYVPFEDAIAEATGPLGNVSSERTWGMYIKPQDKMKNINQPSDDQKKHLKNLVNRDSVLSKVKVPKIEFPEIKELKKEPIDNRDVFEKIREEEDLAIMALPKNISRSSNLPKPSKPIVTERVVPKVIKEEERTVRVSPVAEIVKEVKPQGNQLIKQLPFS